MSLAEKQQHLISRLRIIEDPHERLAAIVARGRNWPALVAAERLPARRVEGCVSPVWLVGSLRAGRCHFQLAAESSVVLGLSALLCELYDGARPDEIAAAAEPEIFEALGLTRQLSPTRLNGLANVRRVIREFAQNAAAS